MIKTRFHACQVLGISINSSENDIKSAYKALVKLYHPDAGACSNLDRYNEVVEAYDFLCSNPAQVFPNTKILGHSNPGPSRATSIKSYEDFQKKMAKQKQQKSAAFEEMTKEYSKMIEKQEEDYNRAMKAIDAIITARAIESIIKSSNKEID